MRAITLYYNGQDVLTYDLDYFQNSVVEYLRDNIVNIFNYGITGIISPYTELIQYGSTESNSIAVSPLIAYSPIGDYIYVSELQDNLKPDSNGLLSSSSGGSFAISTTYYIVAQYAYIDGQSSPVSYHPVTGIAQNTRRTDSYSLYAYLSNTHGGVLLGTITTDSSGAISSIDVTSAKYLTLSAGRVIGTVGSGLTNATYAVGSDVSFQNHIDGIGSGTVTSKNVHGVSAEDIGLSEYLQHQPYAHSYGLVATDTSKTTSLLYISVVNYSPSDNNDYVVIKGLTATNDEALILSDVVLTSSDLGSNYTFNFLSGTTPIDSGYYLFYYDYTTKAIVRSSVYASVAAIKAFVNSSSAIIYPLWSVYWGISQGTPSKYQVYLSSLKDWRSFGDIDSNKLDRNLLAGLSSGLAIGTRNHDIYNARVIGLSNSAYYDIVGTSLNILVNGVTRSVLFSGSDPVLNSVVVSKINQGITDSFISNINEDGYIRFLATEEIAILDGSANEILGISNSMYDNDGNIKYIYSSGQYPGYSELFYDENELLTRANGKYAEKDLISTLTYNENEELIGIEEVTE